MLSQCHGQIPMQSQVGWRLGDNQSGEVDSWQVRNPGIQMDWGLGRHWDPETEKSEAVDGEIGAKDWPEWGWILRSQSQFFFPLPPSSGP